jgi:hypothetical protein
MSTRNKKIYLINSLLVGHSLGMRPAIAHTVKTSSDVAATFHLEPSHNPKAGERATVWFALTKVGGQPIPLRECNCKLEVTQAEQPIASIPLKPINAEQYQGIPGGEVIFPKVGIYQLAFSGTAKDGASFQPFALEYDVTVQPGQNPVTSPTVTPAAPVPPPPSASTPINPMVLGLVAGAVIILGIILWLRNDR